MGMGKEVESLSIESILYIQGVIRVHSSKILLIFVHGYFTGLIGKPGSGKTSMLISWLNGKGNKKFLEKYLIMLLL